MRPADPTRLSLTEEVFITLGLLLSALGLGMGMAYWADQKELDRTGLTAAVVARHCVVAVPHPSAADALYRCDLPTSGTYVSGTALLAEARRTAP